MARNQEKAQSMLNKLLASKQESARPRQQRPYLASECRDLNQADKWRQQVLREIGKKVLEIQNAGLGEHKIRDLNDEINRLIREKGHWERRIVELGGPDYAKSGAPIADSDGYEQAQATGRGIGYRYFGAAKTLPGVKELFEKEAPRKQRVTRAQLYKNIDPDYFGFRDEDDGILLKEEPAAEQRMRREAMERWQAEEAERQAAYDKVGTEAVEARDRVNQAVEAPQFIAYVPLPDTADIEARVLNKKKADLLAKYTSDALAEQQQTAKDFLNKR